MAGNNNLHEAKVQKNDEFYTRLVDIENELGHYTEHFKDKIVLCNCDDPQYSNFCKYFALNFNYLGLKKLITTHYEKGKQSYKLEYARVDDPSGQLSLPKAVQTPLQGDGDFRSEECIEILKEADIVVTNPPFSMVRNYVAQLIEYGKKFVIIGNINMVTYKEFFPLIKGNKVWTGYSFNKTMEFNVPESYKGDKRDDKGRKIVKVPGIAWYTNLDTKKRHEPLFLIKKYDPELYPKYDNYDAINVDKVKDIPCDWDGAVGVPITFLDKYCPEQFEILGFSQGELFIECGGKPCSAQFVKDYYEHGGKGQINDGWKHIVMYANGKPSIPYGRILIKRREGFIK